MSDPDRTDVLNYAQATEYLRDKISDSDLPTRESCWLDVRLMVPTSIPGISEPKGLPRQCNISLQTTLPNLILTLQIEVDLYSCTLCEEGRSLQLEDARLVNSVEIEFLDSQMRPLPALDGSVITAEDKNSDFIKDIAAKGVAWECRGDFRNGSVGEYWDVYRFWLLKSTNALDTPPTLILRTVMQCAETIGHATGGHHFLSSMEDLFQNPEFGIKVKEQVDLSTIEQLHKTRNLNEYINKSNLGDTVDANCQSKLTTAGASSKRALKDRKKIGTKTSLSQAEDKDYLQLWVGDESLPERQTFFFTEGETENSNSTSKTKSGLAHRDRFQQIKDNQNALPAFNMPPVSLQSKRERTHDDFNNQSFKISHDSRNMTLGEDKGKVLQDAEAQRYLTLNTEAHVTHLGDLDDDTELLRKRDLIERYWALFNQARGFDLEDDDLFCQGKIASHHLSSDECVTVNAEERSNTMAGQQEQISRKVALESLARTTSIRSHPKIYYQDFSTIPDDRMTDHRPFAFLNVTTTYNLPQSYANAAAASHQSSVLERPKITPVPNGASSAGERLSLYRATEASKIISSGFNSPYNSSTINNQHLNMIPQAFHIQAPRVEHKDRAQAHGRLLYQHQLNNTTFQSVSQPRIIKVDNHFSTGSFNGHLTSPFTHRYPTRFVSPAEPLAINNFKVVPLIQSTSSRQPTEMATPTLTRTTRRQLKARNSVSLNQPLVNSAEDGKAPDQAYGTSLRLQNS